MKIEIKILNSSLNWIIFVDFRLFNVKLSMNIFKNYLNFAEATAKRVRRSWRPARWVRGSAPTASPSTTATRQRRRTSSSKRRRRHSAGSDDSERSADVPTSNTKYPKNVFPFENNNSKKPNNHKEKLHN